MAAYARSYGLDSLRYINSPLTDYVLQENTGPSRKVTSQLDLPDSMLRYQEEILNMRVPETRPRSDEQGGEAEVRERSKKWMNIMQFGDVRGDMDLAYKPEIEQVPQPYRRLDENPYGIFQRDKEIHARYAWRGEAQKDDMMRNPNSDPKYRHSDTRKYIPGTVRTMMKTTIEDHEVPMYAKANLGKPIQQYRKVENSWILQYCKDKCRVDTVKNYHKVRVGPGLRHEVEDVVEDRTNVNVMFTMIKGDYDRTKRLEPSMPEYADETSTKDIEKKKPMANKKRVNFGNMLEMKDLISVSEKVNRIDKAVKQRMNNRPKLGFSTIEPEEIDENEDGITPQKPGVTRANTFVIHAGFDNISADETKVRGVEKKFKKHYKQNRNTGYEVSPDDDQYSEKNRETANIKKTSLRALMMEMNPVMEKTHSTQQKHHKKQKNLVKHTEGYDMSDPTQQNKFGRPAKTGRVSHREYRRIDEPNIIYDDKVVDIQAKDYVNKARQNRVINPDAIVITNDVEVDVNPRAKRVITYDDKKAFITSEYAMRESLTDKV